MAAKKHKIDAVSASSKPEKEENLEKEEVSVKEETEEAEESSEEASEEAAEDVSEEETKEADKADAEEEDSESEVEGSEEDEDEDDEEESETEPKAKKDRVPAIMVALIYAVIVAVALYYILPSVFAPSFGYTLDEYNTRLEASEISKKMMAQYTTVVPAFKHSIKEIWSIKGEIEPEEQKKLDARFKPFVKTYVATEELENILVEANTRTNDGKLTRLCMYCTYDDKHMTMMMVHFGALLGNFFPDMSFNDAVSLIMNSARDANQEGLYTVKGDIAFKLAADNVGGKLYIKIEVLPAKALKPSQIKTVIHDVNESVATTPATSAS